MISRAITIISSLRSNDSGVALMEFAFILPIFLVVSLSGVELTNYAITRMRISQMALHLADNAARIGEGGQLQAKTISEGDIDDLLTGTGLQAGELDIYRHGRVVISNVEPIANPNPTNRYRITWQRCRGLKSGAGYTPSYTQGQPNIDGGVHIAPNWQRVTARVGDATIYVEVFYEYSSVAGKAAYATVGGSPSTIIAEPASMMVRDRRDLTGGVNGIYPTPGITPSTCNRYTTS